MHRHASPPIAAAPHRLVRTLLRGALWALVLAGLTAPPAAAQCEHWLSSTTWAGVGPGPSGYPPAYVYASTSWDPDGAGPLPARLVVAGSFSAAGAVASSNIAMWDGGAWQSLGDGLTSPTWLDLNARPRVSALAVYNGDLIAGGLFTSASGEPVANIARWNGSAWMPLGWGLNGGVDALLVRNGELIAGGSFTTADGLPARGVSRWDGTAWHPFGAGVDGGVLALADYAGDLIAGGGITASGGTLLNGIARWDGAAWVPLGSGVESGLNAGIVRGMGVLNGELIVCGGFSSAGGFPASTLARWNGAMWRPFGNGTSPNSASALLIRNGELFVGGHVNLWIGGGQNYRDFVRVSRWTGSAWEDLVLTTPLTGGQGYVTSLGLHGESLIIGGSFAGLPVAAGRCVVGWNAGTWTTFGSYTGGSLYGRVYGFAEFANDLIACGEFSTSGGGAGIGRWNGLSWQPLGSGLNSYAYAVRSHAGDLYVGGAFTSAGGRSANRIARWDGSAWHALEPLGANGLIYALLSYNGDLIAAGEFTSIGGVACNRIALWNGAAWSPLGQGLNGYVSALVVHGGDLVACGTFTAAGGQPASRVARWNGASWQALGAGLNGDVYAIEVFNGQLIAGGRFLAGSSSHVAAWDGTSWQGLGSLGASATNEWVSDFEVYNGQLYAGGWFQTIGGTAFHGLARWTETGGGSWQPAAPSPADGLSNNVIYLSTYRGELIVGGSLDSDGTYGYDGWSRFTPTGVPWIAAQPAPAFRPCADGQSAVFSVTAAAGYPSAAYAWRRDGQPLADGPTPSGSVIAGSHTPVLTISGITPADFAAYDCTLTTACGAVTSAAAALSRCRADADANCAINPADVAAFLQTWLASLNSGTLDGDFDASGAVQPADVSAFVLAWFNALNGTC